MSKPIFLKNISLALTYIATFGVSLAFQNAYASDKRCVFLLTDENWKTSEKGHPLWDEWFSAFSKEIKKAYRLTRLNAHQDLKWSGPGLPVQMAASFPAYREYLKAKSFEFAEDDQGKDALEHLFVIPIQLGIENGRRAFLHSEGFLAAKATIENAIELLNESNLNANSRAVVLEILSQVERDLNRPIELYELPAAAFAALRVSKAEKFGWPRESRVVPVSELVDRFYSLITQAYRFQSKAGDDSTEALRRIIAIAIQSGMQGGFKQVQKDRSLYSVDRIKRDLDTVRTILTVTAGGPISAKTSENLRELLQGSLDGTYLKDFGLR